MKRSKRDPLERVVLVMPRSLRRHVDRYAAELAAPGHQPNRSAAARLLLLVGLNNANEEKRKADDLDALHGNG